MFRAALVAAHLTSVIAMPVRVTAASEPVCRSDRAFVERTQTLVVDGTTRSYDVHAPAERSGLRMPVVLAFHGRGETPELLARYSGLSMLPAIVVYPRGLPGRGGKLGWSGTPAAAPQADDVRFVRALLADVESRACVDRSRVYATGKSDGGGFAAQLACKAADLFAAVAPVAGAFYPISGGCRPARAVSILEIHGTADRVVPYRGSQRRELPDIHAWLGAWARRDGCARFEGRSAVASAVERERWTRCMGGAIVVGYRILGGGHTWPGARAPSGPGYTSYALDAHAIIAAFFSL
jgi:polyhydroxybutyrate depolymerase